MILVRVTSANNKEETPPGSNDGCAELFGIGLRHRAERWRFSIECHAESRAARRIDAKSVVRAMLADGQYSIGPSNGVADGGRPERLHNRADDGIGKNKLGTDYLHDVVNGNRAFCIEPARKNSVRSVKEIVSAKPGVEPRSHAKIGPGAIWFSAQNPF